MSTVKYFAKLDISFLVPLGVGAHLEGWGVSPKNITELDWWEHKKIENIDIYFTPSQHFSGRGLNNRNQTLWGSWCFIGSKHKVFYSGDGGYGSHFKEIGNKLGPFDLTLIENGAYNDRWPQVHMLPEEGVMAHIDLGGKYMFPVHWGAYDLAFHNWDEPAKRVTKKAEEMQINLLTPMMGEVCSPKNARPQFKWWE
jgi:L-ascorbate metabolism protein UlaG (beta-lactamase superfamily)